MIQTFHKLTGATLYKVYVRARALLDKVLINWHNIHNPFAVYVAVQKVCMVHIATQTLYYAGHLSLAVL